MMKTISAELIAILAVGTALTGITLMGHAGLHARMDRLEARLTAKIDGVDVRLSGRTDDVEERLASVEEKVTRLDALDIGLRLRALETGQAALREAVTRLEGLMRGLLERLSGEDPPDG